MNWSPALVVSPVNAARIRKRVDLREVMVPDGYMKGCPVPKSVSLVARLLYLREPSRGSYIGHFSSLLDIYAGNVAFPDLCGNLVHSLNKDEHRRLGVPKNTLKLSFKR